MTEGKITPLKNNIASDEKINFTLNELIDVFGASRPTLLRLTHMEGGLPHFYIGKKNTVPTPSSNRMGQSPGAGRGSTVSNLVHDRQLTITTGKSRKATQCEQKQLSLAELYALFAVPHRSAETQAEYIAMPKSQQDDLKDVGGFVGGSLNGPRRKKENVTGRDLITLDFDNIPAGHTEAVISKVDALGCSYCIYSTRKHKPDKPRLRAVIPLDRTALPDEYEALSRFMAAQIGIEWADPTTFEICRLMYWPSCSADGEYIYRVGDKPILPVDSRLNYHTFLYGDWRDPAKWVKHPNATEDSIRAQVRKQADPTEKNGIVGAFCKVYDVHRAIRELIPGVYIPVDTADDRYTFVGGSTTGGAVVYDDGKFLFSHHATDPCSGRLVNAFDLVRLHKFGDKDDSAVPGTPVGRLPSYTLMREWVHSLPEVHIEAATAAADFAGLESAACEDESWKQQLDTTQAGGLKNNLNNIVLILENDSRFKGKLRKDRFNDRIEVDTLPWEHSGGKYWEDVDYDHLRVLMERTVDGKVSASDVCTAVNVAADKNAFHPVKAYLDELQWDGQPRLDTLFIDYLGAADTKYNRAVCRKAFVAAVARIIDPGCKFDCMTVLAGEQGRYKSTFLSTMGGQWFSDSLRTFEGKDAEERLRGVWLIEVSELQGFDRSSVEAIKGFLSKQSDRYRVAYGRVQREFPRQCVFFGTTNALDFLRDTTGGRRFWPVDTDVQNRTKNVVKDLPRERDQIWAEAVTRYRAGEPLYLTGDVEQKALKIQDDHRELDAWEGMLHDYLAKPIPADWDNWPLDRRRDFLTGQLHHAENDALRLVERQCVCAAGFLCEMLGIAPKNLSKQDLTRMGKILRGLRGWSADRSTIPIYGQVRLYRRGG